jgi:hypothetical protein
MKLGNLCFGTTLAAFHSIFLRPWCLKPRTSRSCSRAAMKGTVKMCEVGAEMPAVFRDLFTHKYITSNNIEQNQIKCSMIQTTLL